MAKFSATKLGDLLTKAASVARDTRRRNYAQSGTAFYAVVQIEADDGSWFEMDAEDKAHAIRLADNMVRLGARGASCRVVLPSGTVRLKAFYLKFAD